jgi:hypothetical protein
MKTINYDLLKIKNTSTGEFEPLGMALGLTDVAQVELDKKVNKTDIIDIEQGGTGATTAAAARTNLGVPSVAEMQAYVNETSLGGAW